MSSEEMNRIIVVTSTKNVGIAILLTVFFGPLGMLYSTISGAIVMIIISAIVAFLTIGVGLIVIWPICIIWAAIAADAYNRKITSSSSANNVGTSLIRKLGWVYAVMFLAIAALSYIPALKDSQGYLFGLFSLQLHDDLLHAGSALWAALAAARSSWATRFYFRLFGLVYFFDGIVGLIFGEAYLDLGILFHGPQDYTWAHKIGANIPHILIGGVAILIGFALSHKYDVDA